MSDKIVQKSERIEFIDLVKGVCILFIVVVHVGIILDIPKIDAMRVPLYFVLSGLFF